MKLKIRSKFLSQWPIWRVLKEDGACYDYWDRKHHDKDGLTKEELIDILQRRGHEIIK